MCLRGSGRCLRNSIRKDMSALLCCKGCCTCVQRAVHEKYDGYFYMKTFAPEPVKVIENGSLILVGARIKRQDSCCGIWKEWIWRVRVERRVRIYDGSVVLNKVYKAQKSKNRTPGTKKKQKN